MFSVVILTYQEAQDIVACIETLRPWSDDIHVIDSGSSDATVALAQAAGAHVHTHPMRTYAGQHNWAHQHVHFRYPWVLHLDADERCTPAFAKALQEALHKAPAHCQGFYCCWKLMLYGRWLRRSDAFPRWQLRVLRATVREPYIEFGHAQKENHFPAHALGYVREPYEHYAFSKGWSHWVDKHNRYSTKEAHERLKAPWHWQQCFSRHPSVRAFALKALLRHTCLWPLLRFGYTYCCRLGFLDGWPGWVYCVQMAYYEWLIQLKMHELRASQGRPPSSGHLG
jgi:glycosyltransferase involved in cell wall biosynthesis